MALATRISLVFLALTFSSPLWAQVEWNEPEVVPEKLVRQNRRVLRFSGVTDPGGQIRIRGNRVKMYLNNGTSRWARIPQKNRIQFPVVADESGEFSYDLYLPTTAVEIPVEIYRGGKWVPYSLNFRVPDEGAADDFQAVEESFRPPTDEEELNIEEPGAYSRQSDRGQVIQGRDDDNGKKSPVEFYGGMGFSYFSTTVKTSPSIDVSEGALVIPTFRIGLNWDYNQKWDFRFALRSSSGSIDDPQIASNPASGLDFNWLETQFAAIYYPGSFRLGPGVLGLDFGFQLQSIPFFRQRTGFANLSFFDNDTYALHIGVLYQSPKDRQWPYEIYARYLYPVSAGDAFNIESSFPLMFEFGGGVRRPITPGLAFGIYGQLEYFAMDLSYDNTGTTEFSDMLFTIDVRLIANF